MSILGPLFVVALIGLVVLIILSARRQRAKSRDHFVEAAQATDLAYLETDDGTAQALAEVFDADEFARFHSPSIGSLTPEYVVHGEVAEGYACLFHHQTRRAEGDAREWYIAIVETSPASTERGLIKCRSRDLRRVKEVGGLPELALPDDPAFSAAFITQGEDLAGARACLRTETRRTILEAVAALNFPLDLQIVGGRVALYPADRNYSPATSQDLSDLLVAAQRVAHSLIPPSQADV